MPWLKVGSQGAEYGTLKWTDAGRDLKLGERVEIYCTTLDMSTAVYDRYYVVRGDQIVDVWPIMGRGGAAQRCKALPNGRGSGRSRARQKASKNLCDRQLTDESVCPTLVCRACAFVGQALSPANRLFHSF